MKSTYYDVLKKHKPKLLEFLEKENEILRNKKDLVPFGSIDDFSKYFQNYIEAVRNEVANNI